MNIFVVDKSPTISAQNLCNKHVVKMIIETAQMLSTAHRVLDGIPYVDVTASGRKVKRYKHPYNNFDLSLCKAVMQNHPCTKWCMETHANYEWLYQHGRALLQEYHYRYERHHSMTGLYNMFLSGPPIKLCMPSRNERLTPFAQAMPDKYKDKDAVVAYRNYYLGEKAKFAQWKKRNPPEWYSEGLTMTLSLV